MSVRDLLADLLDPPPPDAMSAGMAAKAAKAAKTRANACSPPDLRVCEGLRISAKTAPRDPIRDRVARLMRWGWPQAEAEALAVRAAMREADDPRRLCVQCAHFRPWRCDSHEAAGLQSPDVGRDLATLPQHCDAWTPREHD